MILIEFRCEKDNKLLAKLSGEDTKETIEIKCPRCGFINRYRPQTKPKPNIERQ